MWRQFLADSKIIVALDFEREIDALRLVDQLDPFRCKLKIGKQMFTRSGPAFVKTLVEKGFKVFLDLKFHDIPNTVQKSCQAAKDLGVWMVNVHALGGGQMVCAARVGLGDFPDKPLLTAVTVLTSHDQQSLSEIGFSGDIPTAVRKLAKLALENGADGVVSSAHEILDIRAETREDFLIVTPGIRLPGDRSHDQKRIMTPKDAITSGANYLVIGRSITKSNDPMSVIEKIERDMTA